MALLGLNIWADISDPEHLYTYQLPFVAYILQWLTMLLSIHKDNTTVCMFNIKLTAVVALWFRTKDEKMDLCNAELVAQPWGSHRNECTLHWWSSLNQYSGRSDYRITYQLTYKQQSAQAYKSGILFFIIIYNDYILLRISSN